MTKTLVIGYGNTLRGDDAVGVHAAEMIANRHPEIECICTHQLTPELAEKISEHDIVFFLDADVNAAQLNTRLVSPNILEEQPRTHFISPESLLSLAQQLYQRTPFKSYVIGIPASQFEFSEKLSEISANAVNQAVELLEMLLNNADK